MYDDVPNSATDLQNKDRVSQFQTHMVKHKKYVFFICSSAFTQVKSTGTGRRDAVEAVGRATRESPSRSRVQNGTRVTLLRK